MIKGLLRYCLVAVIFCGMSLPSDATRYHLVQVTSVHAGGLYVFEQGGYVMYNKISDDFSGAVSTINDFQTEGLSGSEEYVWTLESKGNGFLMRNRQSLVSSKEYLRNKEKSSTTMEFCSSSDATVWSFTFKADNTVYIKNTYDRYLGYISSTKHVYRAYSFVSGNESMNDEYPHFIKVYELQPMPTTLSLLDANAEETTAAQTAYGTPLSLTASVPEGYDGVLSAESSNADVATVAVSGHAITVTPVAVGTATITVNAPATADYAGTASATVTVSVTAPEGLTECPQDGPATVSATIAASGYGTFCCQYPLDLSAVADGCSAWFVSSISGNTVFFSPVTTTISGGVPVVLYGTPGTYSLNVATSSDNRLPSNMLRGALAPTFLTPTSVENDVEYTNFGLVGGVFVKATAGTLPAGKAYLPVPTSLLPTASSRISVAFGGISTAVTAPAAAPGAVTVSDLQGRRLSSGMMPSRLHPGLYIVDGRKIVVR